MPVGKSALPLLACAYARGIPWRWHVPAGLGCAEPAHTEQQGRLRLSLGRRGGAEQLGGCRMDAPRWTPCAAQSSSYQLAGGPINPSRLGLAAGGEACGP